MCMWTHAHTHIQAQKTEQTSGITDFLILKIRMLSKFSKTTSVFLEMMKAQALNKTVIN